MSEIPHGVLSEGFQSVINGRRLRAAVFLTFKFDPGFFEQEVLPVFLDVPLSHVPAIKLLSLAEALRQVDRVAVYYDRQALEAGAHSSKLDVQRIPIAHPTGYFHPKNVLALVEDEPQDDGSVSESLIVAAMSANLTRAGWWENVEVAHIEEVTQGSSCSFRSDLLALLRRIRQSARSTDQHGALDAIEQFVRRLSQDDQTKRDRVVLPRLFSGDAVIPWLMEFAGNRLQRCNLEILSPYFDNTGSLGPIEALKEAFRPSEIRIFLPRGLEDEALCSSAYFTRVADIARWGKLPKDVMQPAKGSDRRLHAKVYRFFDPARDYQAFFVGSVNLTGAAFNRGGNVESGFFVEVPGRRLDWWLSLDRKPPMEFTERSEDEGLPEGSGWKLSLRFVWKDETASCFWDDNSASPPLTLLSHGAELAHLESLASREWKLLAAVETQAIKEALRSSSFVTVRIAGEPDSQILVDEEEMPYKPSLMATFTADEILRYWSMLTAEQKKEFLEEHATDFDDPEIAMWLGDSQSAKTIESFFDTFAELYLSFGNLERAVKSALREHREREAVDRLFGRKFDSLRRLIECILDETEGDAVRRYVSLLCARQLLDSIESEQAEFVTAHRSDIVSLRQLLDRSGEIRDRFSLGQTSESETFFRWFDRWFLRRAQPIEVSAE